MSRKSLAEALKLPEPGYMTPKKPKREPSAETPYSPAVSVDIDFDAREIASAAQKEEEEASLTRKGLRTPDRPTRKTMPGAPRKQGGRKHTKKRGRRHRKVNK